VVKLFTDYGVVGVLALMIGLLFVLIVAVMVLGIEPRRRSLEDLGGGDAAEDGSVQAPAIAR
jgi:putative MFS transporter